MNRPNPRERKCWRKIYRLTTDWWLIALLFALIGAWLLFGTRSPWWLVPLLLSLLVLGVQEWRSRRNCAGCPENSETRTEEKESLPQPPGGPIDGQPLGDGEWDTWIRIRHHLSTADVGGDDQ